MADLSGYGAMFHSDFDGYQGTRSETLALQDPQRVSKPKYEATRLIGPFKRRLGTGTITLPTAVCTVQQHSFPVKQPTKHNDLSQRLRRQGTKKETRHL